LSGHAVDTESAQRLPNAEVTVAFVTVALPPGVKADVAALRVVRQVLRPESEFRLFKNVVQVDEIEEGIRGFCVEPPEAADDVEDWAKATEANAEISVRVLNILEAKKY